MLFAIDVKGATAVGRVKVYLLPLKLPLALSDQYSVELILPIESGSAVPPEPVLNASIVTDVAPAPVVASNNKAGK